MADDNKNTVTLTKEDFDRLIGDIEKLKKEVHGPKGMKNPEESKKHTVAIRFVNNKPIIGLVNRGTENRPMYSYSVPDPKDPKEKILMVDVLVAGDKNPYPFTHEELRQETEVFDCEIIKKKTTPWSVEQGTVERVEYKDNGYGAKGTDDYVETGPKGEYATYIIKTPQGEEIEVDEKVLNIK